MSNKAVVNQVVKHTLTPKLRFPTFRGTDTWKAIPLSKLAERSNRKNKSGELKLVLTNSAEFGVIDQRDYFDKDIASQGNLAGYLVVENGDYVYNPRISRTAPVGPIANNNIAEGVMSPLYIRSTQHCFLHPPPQRLPQLPRQHEQPHPLHH